MFKGRGFADCISDIVERFVAGDIEAALVYCNSGFHRGSTSGGGVIGGGGGGSGGVPEFPNGARPPRVLQSYNNNMLPLLLQLFKKLILYVIDLAIDLAKSVNLSS